MKTYRLATAGIGFFVAAVTCYAIVQLWAWAGSPEPRVQTVHKIVTHIAKPQPLESNAGEHPLDRPIALAKQALATLEKVDGYTATLVKRERIGDDLCSPEKMELKLRHEPLSIYLKFLTPDSVAGREVIYVEGANDGKLLVHMPGPLMRQLGTLALNPTGFLALQGQRYPITELGVKKLTEQLIERGEHDQHVRRAPRVQFFHGAKIGDTPALRIEVVHQEQWEDDPAYKAVVYLNAEHMIPIRYEGYGWPATPDEEPSLLEQYTYLDVELNPGLTDADFETGNRAYRFP